MFWRFKNYLTNVNRPRLMQDHKTGVNFSNILNYFPCEFVSAIIAASNSFNNGFKSF